MRRQKGVFNADQHEEEIQMLLRGEIKQMQIIAIDLANVGPAKVNGNTQGMIEMEGNALTVITSFLDRDLVVRTSVTNAISPQLYVRFNHSEAPWLPMGNPTAFGGTSRYSTSFVLTYGRFWVYNALAVPGSVMYLLVSKGVCIYSAENLGPVIQGAYQPPGWTSLR